MEFDTLELLMVKIPWARIPTKPRLLTINQRYLSSNWEITQIFADGRVPLPRHNISQCCVVGFSALGGTNPLYLPGRESE